MNELCDKVAIVTGSGRGIGRGIAIAMGKAGAKVVVASRTRATIDAVVTAIRDAGGEATGVSVDVGKRGQIYRAIEQAVKAYGGVDILVNNAQGFGTEEHPGGSAVYGPIDDVDESELEYSYRTGVLGTFWAMRAAMPYLKSRGGCIINFGSTAAEIGNEGTVSYNMTKAAIKALTKTAAREWGKHNITVNLINPMIQTDAYSEFQKSRPKDFAEQLREIPLGRLGTVEEVGALAVFLASDGARSLTGLTLYIDCGHYKGR